MDYFILKLKDGSFYCVNHISRCKDSSDVDIMQFVMSGKASRIEMDKVIGIFPMTPFPGMTI